MGDMKEIFEAHKELAKEKRMRLSEPRMEAAKRVLFDIGVVFYQHDNDSFKIHAPNKPGKMIHFWPCSGWFQGAGISGRGIRNLIKKIKPSPSVKETK